MISESSANSKLSQSRYCEYDVYAKIYNDNIGDRLSQRAIKPLSHLLFSTVPAPAYLLDLCCGTGHLAADLCRRGYQVVGLDGSAEMLHYAHLNAPDVEFLLADARSFSLSQPVQAIISTSDSLNHILSLDELQQVFENVFYNLVPLGYFIFDFNLEERYQADTWNGSLTGSVTDDYAWAAGRLYQDGLGQVHLTIFKAVQDDLWRRTDQCLIGRSQTIPDLEDRLRQVGFTGIEWYDAQADFDSHDWGPGKVYCRCQKPA